LIQDWVDVMDVEIYGKIPHVGELAGRLDQAFTRIGSQVPQ